MSFPSVVIFTQQLHYRQKIMLCVLIAQFVQNDRAGHTAVSSTILGANFGVAISIK